MNCHTGPDTGCMHQEGFKRGAPALHGSDVAGVANQSVVSLSSNRPYRDILDADIDPAMHEVAIGLIWKRVFLCSMFSLPSIFP